MVILRKLKASTLIETLVASVLIVILFMVASLILNNTFLNTIRSNTNNVSNRMSKLHYLKLNNELSLPYKEVYNQWNVSLDIFLENNIPVLEIEAIHLETNKTIIKKYFEVQ